MISQTDLDLDAIAATFDGGAAPNKAPPEEVLELATSEPEVFTVLNREGFQRTVAASDDHRIDLFDALAADPAVRWDWAELAWHFTSTQHTPIDMVPFTGFEGWIGKNADAEELRTAHRFAERLVRSWIDTLRVLVTERQYVND